MKYDFHIHSTYSDGSSDVEDIFIEASKKQIDALAITDHDTILGINEEEKLSKKYHIPFIPAAEFTACEQGIKFHVLAYNIDYKSQELIDYSNKLLAFLNSKSEKQIVMLQEKGINIEKKEFFKEAKGGPLYRAKLLKTLSNYGYLREDEIMNSLKKYFGKDGLCFVEDEYRYLSFNEICSMIKRNNGSVVLAHPAKIKKKNSNLYYDLINSSELDGIELYHPSINEEVFRELSEIIARKNYIVTGGSDYHGIFNKLKTPIGGVDICENISYRLLKSLH